MRTMIFLTLFIAGLAQANQSNPVETYSRALQQAKRVAVMENGRDLPSRAFWLSQRVVANSKSIAYHLPKSESKAPKKASN